MAIAKRATQPLATGATHLALLRGINVGKAKRIAMADLRAVMESLGCTGVRTLLNSGNVVYNTRKQLSGWQVQQAILNASGVDTRTTVLTVAELDTIIREHPMVDVVTDHTRFVCYVTPTVEELAKLEPLLAMTWAPEQIALGSRAAYVWSPDGLLAGKLFEFIGKRLRDATTARNWATMCKLHLLVHGS